MTHTATGEPLRDSSPAPSPSYAKPIRERAQRHAATCTHLEEILHAYRNPLRMWDLGDGFTMMIGPNAAAIILEVGSIDGDTAVVIVHAMRAREKYLR